MTDGSGEAREAMRASIQRLLRPKSVALLGASPTPGSLGGGVLANLERFGYKGELHLVHPTRAEVHGRACLASVDELPQGVDCAVLAIPSPAVMPALEACARRGVGGIIIFSAGFAELGEEGRQRQQQLAQFAKSHSIAVEGPNCLGMINFVEGVPLTFGMADFIRVDRPAIALVSQSGAMATVVRAALHARDLQVSFSISTGNEAVNGVEDFLEAMLADDMTRAVGMVVEQFRSPRRFLELARQARRAGKPIVLLHPGRSRAARESAQTHTGAMMGDYEVMRTAVAAEGVAIVETLEELIDLCELFVRCPSPPRSGAAVLTESGAHKGLVLDYCETIGLALPQPTGATRQALDQVAPGLITAANPLDTTAQALVDPGLYGKCLLPLMADPSYGSLVLAIICSNATMTARKLPPVIDAIRTCARDKPIVFAMLGEDATVPPDLITQLRALDVPFFRSPERALRALAKFTSIGMEAAFVASSPLAQGSRSLDLAPGVVPEYASKRLLAQAGIHVPDGVLVRDLPEALAAAERIGWPVALKAQSSALPHKSDAGAVKLGLRDAASLAQAWAGLHADIARAAPGLDLDGVLVEAMAETGVELIVGARRDRDWGPMVVMGFGGVFAELLQDVRMVRADCSRQRLTQELQRLAGARLLAGFRGSRTCDVDAIVESAHKLGKFVIDHPEIAEVEINPLIVHEKGRGATAVDALIVAR